MIKQVEKKSKGGRPSKFDSINKEQLKKLVLKGFTEQEIADFFEIDKSTLTHWKQRNNSFFTSLKDWKAEADHVVERSLYERAIGYRTTFKKNFVISDGKDLGSHVEKAEEEVVFPPDPTSCIFWLKNRQPDKWREKIHNVNLNGQSDDPDFIRQFFGFHKNGNGKH